MEEILLQYLYQHKILVLSPIGELRLEYTPATISEANNLLQPQESTINHIFNNAPFNIEKTIYWLSKKLSISFDEALQKLQQFEHKIQSKIKEGEPFHWNNLGTFNNNHLGVVYFSPLVKSIATGQPIYIPHLPQTLVTPPIEAINTVKALATSDEIDEEEIKNNPPVIHWKLLIGVLIVLAGLILLYYFKGNSFDSFQYKQKTSPSAAPPTYEQSGGRIIDIAPSDGENRVSRINYFLKKSSCSRTISSSLLRLVESECFHISATTP